MTADLDADNIVAPQPSNTYATPENFLSGALANETAPVGGGVQPFAALHLYEAGAGTVFSAGVSPGSYGTVSGITPAGTKLSNPTTGTLDQYGNYEVSGTRTQVEDALRQLTLSLDANGDGVTLAVTVYGGNIFPNEAYTSVIAAAGVPTSGLNFIHGTPGNDLLSASGESDLFVIGPGQSGFDTILGFDPAHDILRLGASAASSFADVQANIGGAGPGAYIRLANGGAVNLIGVDPGSLHASNFNFV